MFHLASAFEDVAIDIPVGDRTFHRTIGRTQLVNPLRYGATTFLDYARWRLSVFSRAESAAIGPRAGTAPPSESLRQHAADQAAIVAAIQAQRTH